jgi:hypothetical protein
MLDQPFVLCDLGLQILHGRRISRTLVVGRAAMERYEIRLILRLLFLVAVCLLAAPLGTGSEFLGGVGALVQPLPVVGGYKRWRRLPANGTEAEAGSDHSCSHDPGHDFEDAREAVKKV